MKKHIFSHTGIWLAVAIAAFVGLHVMGFGFISSHVSLSTTGILILIGLLVVKLFLIRRHRLHEWASTHFRHRSKE